MLKTLYDEIGSAAPAAQSRGSGRRRSRATAPAPPPARSRDNPATATLSSRARGSTSAGSEKETWHIEFDLAGSGLDYAVGDCVRPVSRRTIRRWSMPSSQALGAPPDFPIGGRTLREVLTDGVSLAPAPDMLFQLFSYITGGERRQKAKALARRRRSRRRCRHPRRARRDREISRHAPRPGSLHRGARSAAAAALLDRVLAQGRSRAASRSPSMRCATRSASARASASPRPSSPTASRARRQAQGLRAEGARLRPAGRSATPIIMIGPGTGVAPFRAFLHERMATKATGRNWLFFGHQRSRLRFLLRGRVRRHEGEGRAHAPLARLVARRRARNSTCRTACARSAASCGMARRRRARLCLRRRQAHGQGRRARAGRHRGAARRALDRSGDRLRGGPEESRAATSRTSIDGAPCLCRFPSPRLRGEGRGAKPAG